MSLKTDLPKWLFASVFKSFTDNISGLTVHIEGTRNNTSSLSDWCELRVDGPNIDEVSKDFFRIYAEVNILIGTVMHSTNLYQEQENIGKVMAAFNDIKIYKYGSGASDDGSLLGCIRLLPTDDIRQRLQIQHFGQIDPALSLLQTTIEGHYEVFLRS